MPRSSKNDWPSEQDYADALERIVTDAMAKVLKNSTLKPTLVSIVDKDRWARGLLLDWLLVTEIDDENTYYRVTELLHPVPRWTGSVRTTE